MREFQDLNKMEDNCRAAAATHSWRHHVWTRQRASFIQAEASWNVSGVLCAADLTTVYVTVKKHNLCFFFFNFTCSGAQKMWASSWQNLRTRVRPPRAPESSLRCSAPKSAHRRGSSRHERTRCSNMRLKHKKPESGPVKTSSCRDVCTCWCSPVSRTVHGLQSEGLRALRCHSEHVLAVVLPVARALPQCSAVQSRGHDLCEASPSVLALCEVRKEGCVQQWVPERVRLSQRGRYESSSDILKADTKS